MAQRYSRIARFWANAQKLFPEARWQSGHAAACKAVYAGSIPTLASNSTSNDVQNFSETLILKGIYRVYGYY
jgi:hypothetical protein